MRGRKGRDGEEGGVWVGVVDEGYVGRVYRRICKGGMHGGYVWGMSFHFCFGLIGLILPFFAAWLLVVPICTNMVIICNMEYVYHTRV